MLTESIAITRILISALFGCCIGIERYIHKHPAGVRTFMLICIASTLATLASIWICQTNLNLINGDPGRIAAQVVTGIGFIGAGGCGTDLGIRIGYVHCDTGAGIIIPFP